MSVLATSRKGKNLSERVSQVTVEKRYPPEGSPFLWFKFARWQFFTGMGEWDWDTLFVDYDEGKELYERLRDIYG